MRKKQHKNKCKNRNPISLKSFLLILPICFIIAGDSQSGAEISRGNTNFRAFIPTGSITCLLFSDDGKVLWAGTPNGLEKRNADTGQLIRKYLEVHGLPQDYVTSLASDGSGGIWVGTLQSGLGHLLPDDSWQVVPHFGTDVSTTWILSLAPDGAQGVWVGTQTIPGGVSPGSMAFGALLHLSADGVWEAYKTYNSDLPGNYVYALAADSTGGVWIGANAGLGHLWADGTWEVFQTDNSELPDNTVLSLAPGDGGGVWAGTREGGLARLTADGAWQVFTRENSDLPDNKIQSLTPDDLGGVWAGTENGGLARLSAYGAWKVYHTSNGGLSDNNVPALSSDGTGGLWVGTYSYGLARILPDGIAAGPSPMASQPIFATGDRLLVTLPSLVQDKDSYVAVMLPEGQMYFFTDVNTLSPYDSQDFPLWTGESTVADLTVTSELPRGEYTVFLLRVTTGQHPKDTAADRELGTAKFQVQ